MHTGIFIKNISLCGYISTGNEVKGYPAGQPLKARPESNNMWALDSSSGMEDKSDKYGDIFRISAKKKVRTEKPKTVFRC